MPDGEFPFGPVVTVLGMLLAPAVAVILCIGISLLIKVIFE